MSQKSLVHTSLFLDLKKDIAGKYRFNLVGANRKIILSSEAYNHAGDRNRAAAKIARTFQCDVTVRVLDEKTFLWVEHETLTAISASARRYVARSTSNQIVLFKTEARNV